MPGSTLTAPRPTPAIVDDDWWHPRFPSVGPRGIAPAAALDRLPRIFNTGGASS